MKVAEILALKGSVVFTIKPSETIATLSQLLRDRRIGAAIVSSDGEAIAGVISERDVAYGLSIHKADLHTLPVSALMTKTVITCSPVLNLRLDQLQRETAQLRSLVNQTDREPKDR